MAFEPKTHAVAFDLDGTLVDGIPYEEVLKYVSQFTGVPYDDLFIRYKTAWVDLEEAESYHVSLAPKCASMIRELYRTFSDAKGCPEVLPGAREVLMALKSRRTFLVCWTRGEETLQRLALRNTELDQFFNRIIVIPNKNAETVQGHLLPALEGLPFTMIGDSYEQDIVPVLGLAEACIWISDSNANRFGPRPWDIHPSVREIRRIGELLLD